MILLDTNALVWLEANHRRAQPLKNVRGTLNALIDRAKSAGDDYS